MKFCYFASVPWPHLKQRPDAWPFPNTGFDPDLGAACFDEAVAQLIAAEAHGFDAVGVGEDHMTAYGMTPNPLLMLAIVARQTRRVELITMGTPLPLLNPVRVAEEMAMVDLLSHGRMVAGLIRGVPQNYAAYNIDPNESHARFAEGIELITRLWTATEPFSWESAHYRFPKLSLWPRPLTQPHPPFLFSANSTRSARIGAEHRARIGAIHLYNRDAIDRVADAIEAYRQTAAENHWEPTADRFLIGLQTCIAPTDTQARERFAPALDYQYNVLSGTYNAEKRRIAATTGYGLSPTEEAPPSLDERLEAGTVLCGSPDTVTEQIRQLESRLGVGTVAFHMQVGNLDPAHASEGMALFRDRIRPKFPQSGDAA